MGEPDLLGYDDCRPDFLEGDTDTAEHARHSAYWAVSTDRGQDWEEPSRWADLLLLVQAKGEALAASIAANVSADLEDVDSRVLRAVYRIGAAAANGIRKWTAEIALRGAPDPIIAEGEVQPTAQEPLPPPPPAPVGVAEKGTRSLRQLAVNGALFPHWLLGFNSGKIVWTIAASLDAITEWTYLGLQQRLPLVADPGALPWLGRMFGIQRGMYEPELAYRRRLTRWMPSWARAGTCFSVVEQIQGYFPDRPIVHLVQHDPGHLKNTTRATWNTLAHDGTEQTTVATPSNWDWDSEDAARPAFLDERDMRFWIVIEQPAGAESLFADPGPGLLTDAADVTKAGGVAYAAGGRIPADLYTDFQNLAATWAQVGAWLAGVFVVFGTVNPSGSGGTYPNGRWHEALNDTLDGSRYPDHWRVLYLHRRPETRLPETPAPFSGG